MFCQPDVALMNIDVMAEIDTVADIDAVAAINAVADIVAMAIMERFRLLLLLSRQRAVERSGLFQGSR